MSDEVVTVHIQTLTNFQRFQFDQNDTVQTVLDLYHSLLILADDTEVLFTLDGARLEPETQLKDLPLTVDGLPNPILAFPIHNSPDSYSVAYDPPEDAKDPAKPDSEASSQLADRLKHENFDECESWIAARICEDRENNYEVARNFLDGNTQDFLIDSFDEACFREVQRIPSTEWTKLSELRTRLYPNSIPYREFWGDSQRRAFYAMPENDQRWIVDEAEKSSKRDAALTIFRKNGRDRVKTLRELQRP
jgi:hypothetical protein